jgi:hypothetical protein
LPGADPDQGPPIDDADFLLLSLNNTVTYHDLPPAETFTERFEQRPVYTVFRGRGPYRMAVAEVYRRRSSG